MKVLVSSTVLLALVFACCKSADRISRSNSSARSPKPGGEIVNSRPVTHEPCINLNNATADELARLPGIGEVIAKRVIDYREHNGRFRRPEEIIIIEGFSERKYRAIAGMICVE